VRPQRERAVLLDDGVEEVTAAAPALTDSLSTAAGPRNRDAEADKAGERSRRRFGRC
jgi:hypothetical protein